MKICLILILLSTDLFAELDLNNDYHVKLEWFEVVSYDKRYISHLSATTFKHNRTQSAINASFVLNVNMGYDMEVIAQTYKFRSNEYRYFPIRLQVNFCKALSSNVAGLQSAIACGNFSGCPLVKGKFYHFCNLIIDERKFPPRIPTGKYMMESQGLYLSQELFIVRGYTEVTPVD